MNPLGQPAVLTFNSHITGLAVARSLGPRGVPVVALDRHPSGVGLYSKHSLVAGICPNPIEDEEGFISYLEEVGGALEKRALLFPTNDEWVLAVSRHRARLERCYILPYSPLEVVEPILNKTLLYKAAERLGVAIPRTWYLSEQPVEEVARQVEYPCVLKPAEQRLFYDRFGAKLWVVHDREELLRLAVEAQGYEMLVQELIEPGPDTFYSLCSYTSEGGKAEGMFVGRKVEQYPPFSGTACLVDARWAPEIAERGASILAEFGYQGIAETEFMRDPRDGEFKLIDLNTRVWKWIGLPIRCGVDLPWLAYADALGESVSPSSRVEGTRWVYGRDYLALLKERGQVNHGEALSSAEWASLVSGEFESGDTLLDAVYSPTDPMPFVRLLQNEAGQSRYYCAC